MPRPASHEAPDIRTIIIENGQRIMASKGFSAVGLNEVLTAAHVPKGSFYHYFASKEVFGKLMLEAYFDDYLAELDAILSVPEITMAQRLLHYWQHWQDTQSFFDCQGKCLAVKLGAEVADLSDPMRLALQSGTTAIIDRIRMAIEAGVAEGSLSIDDDAATTARNLYQLWLGASVMVKIARNTEPFESASAATRQILHLPSAS